MVPGLSFGLYDVLGGFYGPIRGRTVGSRVSVDTHQHASGLLRLSLHDPLAQHISPLRMVVRAWLDGEPILAGPVGAPVFDSESQTVEVPILGPSQRLRSPLGQRTDGAGIPGHAAGLPLRVEQIPEGELMWSIVEHLRPTPDELDAGVPDHGVVRGDIEPGQPRDREWEAGKEGWEAIVQLAEVIDGQDFHLRAIHDEQRPWALAALDVGRLGRDQTSRVILWHGAGDQTAASLKFTPGASQGLPVLNRLTATGDAPEVVEGALEAPVPPVYTANQFESQLAYGTWGAHIGLTGVKDIDTLAQRVGETVSTAAFPVEHFEVKPAMQDGSALLVVDGQRRRVPGFGRPPRIGPAGELWLGDLFRVRGELGVMPVDFTGEALGFDLEEADEEGNVQATIRVAPTVKAAVSV